VGVLVHLLVVAQAVIVQTLHLLLQLQAPRHRVGAVL
jgi:hypothetical protein